MDCKHVWGLRNLFNSDDHVLADKLSSCSTSELRSAMIRSTAKESLAKRRGVDCLVGYFIRPICLSSSNVKT